ncbi:SDR family oxidoreductase [Testudinibacter sp. P27/CKL/0425]
MLALITGASAGFGAATARLLVQHGHRVIIAARRQQRLTALQQELGENCLALAFDVCDQDAVLTALHSLPPEWQQIGLLINNAGLALGIESAQKSRLQDWQQMIATNIGGLVTLTHAILPGMVERNRGHIINLGSIAGDYPYPGGNVYGATKAFVKQFSLNLRADLVGTAVRVSNIEPGLCGGTEFSNVRFYGDNDKAEALYANVDFLTPEDIAATLVWVAEQPPHVNINRIEIMPVAQAPAGLTVKKKA